MQIRWLGLVSYEEALALQTELARQRAMEQIPDTLLLLEHPHTYTFGRSGHLENLLWDEAERARRGISLHWVDRGGDVTYHGPGQLVGYPILRLGQVDPASGLIAPGDYIGYVRRLEKLLIGVLASFGLVAGQLTGSSGVFIQPDLASRCAHCPPAARLAASKIAAIGVKVDARGISSHGFALNVAPDMDYFNGIVGCGLKDHPAICMADLLSEPPAMSAVVEAVSRLAGTLGTDPTPPHQR